MERKEDLVICTYTENGASFEEIIIEAFTKYVMSNLQIDKIAN